MLLLIMFTYVTIRDRWIYRADIWVLLIYRYRPKWPILSALLGVDKTLSYSFLTHSDNLRKKAQRNKSRQFLVAMLTGLFS